ncbi:hypothetical protein [Thalassotalea aquiviva]|uniref:hypothetical protein n=1 Tax=Thalassotalea aquiviva TaxID=3242415 RepID=UPI00352ADCB2
MLKSFFNTLILLLSLLAVFGQGLANASMSCAQMSSHQSPQQTTERSTEHHHTQPLELLHANHQQGHDGHHMVSNVEPSSVANDHHNNSLDCCQDQCFCPANGCSTASMLVLKSSFYFSPLYADKVNVAKFTLTQSTLSSLYRPPISPILG